MLILPAVETVTLAQGIISPEITLYTYCNLLAFED